MLLRTSVVCYRILRTYTIRYSYLVFTAERCQCLNDPNVTPSSWRSPRFAKGPRFSSPVQRTLGPNLPPVQWVPCNSREVNRPGRGVDHPPHLERRLKKSTATHLLPLWVFVACSRANFTLLKTSGRYDVLLHYESRRIHGFYIINWNTNIYEQMKKINTFLFSI
jgi:hypothetical protein